MLDYIHVRGTDVVIQPPSGGNAIINGVVFAPASINAAGRTLFVDGIISSLSPFEIVGNTYIDGSLSASGYIMTEKFLPGMDSATADGNSLATAAQLTAYCYQAVAGADGTKGVKLPEITGSNIGLIIIVHNSAGSILKVYPYIAGDEIFDKNVGAGAGVAVSVAADETAMFIANSSTTWVKIFSYA